MIQVTWGPEHVGECRSGLHPRAPLVLLGPGKFWDDWMSFTSDTPLLPRVDLLLLIFTQSLLAPSFHKLTFQSRNNDNNDDDDDDDL